MIQKRIYFVPFQLTETINFTRIRVRKRYSCAGTGIYPAQQSVCRLIIRACANGRHTHTRAHTEIWHSRPVRLCKIMLVYRHENSLKVDLNLTPILVTEECDTRTFCAYEEENLQGITDLRWKLWTNSHHDDIHIFCTKFPIWFLNIHNRIFLFCSINLPIICYLWLNIYYLRRRQ